MLLADGVAEGVPVGVVDEVPEVVGVGVAVVVGRPVGKPRVLVGVGVGVGVVVTQPVPATGNTRPWNFRVVHLAGFFFFALGMGPIRFHAAPVNTGFWKFSTGSLSNSAWAKVFQILAGQ